MRAWLASLFGRRTGDPDARTGWLIIVGSIPIVVLGLALQDGTITAGLFIGYRREAAAR